MVKKEAHLWRGSHATAVWCLFRQALCDVVDVQEGRHPACKACRAQCDAIEAAVPQEGIARGACKNVPALPPVSTSSVAVLRPKCAKA